MVDDILCKIYSPEFLPVRKNPGDAGADLKSTGYASIRPGGTIILGTGVKLSIPEGHVGLVFSRSGIAAKQGLRLANCVGVIDSGYRGEIMIPLHNDSDVAQEVERGDRVAQIVIVPIVTPEFMAVDELPESERGSGGFGSTGIS